MTLTLMKQNNNVNYLYKRIWYAKETIKQGIRGR